jgi:uncharacterized protein (TIGR03663 family)
MGNFQDGIQMESQNGRARTWLDTPITRIGRSDHETSLTVETVLIGLILILAVVSRFMGLGDRAASHDEVNHFVPSYELSQGKGYAYDPLSHGPFQFHSIALSFFLFGANDATARIPAALFSVATVAIGMLAFRRYLGRAGALAAGVLFLISPYMLFYGRYARNEAFIVVWAMVALYAILRYLERGETWVLVLYATINAFHFVDKATAYIFAAEQALFLGVYLISRLIRHHDAFKLDETRRGLARFRPLWQALRAERAFDLLVLLVSLVLPLSAALPMKLVGLNPTDYSTAGVLTSLIFVSILLAAAIAIGLVWRPRTWLICAAIFYGIFILFFSTFFTNPFGLVGGLMGALGYWMQQQGVDRGSQPLYYYLFLQIPVYEFLPALGTLAAAWIAARHGLWQSAPEMPFERPLNPGRLTPAAVEADIDREGELETVLGEAISSADSAANAAESVVEIAGSEAAQPVKTGAHPGVEAPGNEPGPQMDLSEGEPPVGEPRPVPIAALLIYWSISSLIAFTLAGEKMPWLTIHITLPMILATGWAVGYCSNRLIAAETGGSAARSAGPFHRLMDWTALLLLPLFGLGGIVAVAALGRLAGGQGLDQDPARFLLGLAGALFSAGLLGWITRNWAAGQLGRVILLVSMAFLAVLTARAAYRAAYILYDDPDEYLVYAHGTPDPKRLLTDLNTIASRTNTGRGLVVAYDNFARYPYWWYLRDYPNRVDYNDQPTANIRNAAVVFAGEKNYSKVESILRNDFVSYNYVRLWWPNQDYWRLKYDQISAERTSPTGQMGVLEYLGRAWGHISPFFTNERVRSAVWQIWFNRNYSEWAALQSDPKVYTHQDWQPADRMRMYIRRDIAAQAGYLSGGDSTVAADPYQKVSAPVVVERAVGQAGGVEGQFHGPRAVALAADGSLYVADTLNNRIQHLNADGTLLKTWGSPADVSAMNAPGGTFNQPWGVAVGPDGSVYVSDTWNHRVQKFSSDGQFVTMWGHLVQGDQPDGFYGPRGIAVDAQGRVYVADTGNKRVVVFDVQGAYLTSFGSTGSDKGQLDEPVGVAVDGAGNVFVADTWNQRVQVFSPGADGKSFVFKTSWSVDAWYGQSIDNKPYLAVDGQNNTYVTDPEACRVLVFAADGSPLHAWDGCMSGNSDLTMPSGIAVDAGGGAWVSDASANRLVYIRAR